MEVGLTGRADERTPDRPRRIERGKVRCGLCRVVLTGEFTQTHGPI